MKIALDLRTVTGLIEGDPAYLRGHMDAALEQGEDLVMSSLVLHELAYQALASEQPARRLAQLDAFIAQVEVVAWTSEDALTAARMRADHEKALGHPLRVEPSEVLCAAQALNNDWAMIAEDRLRAVTIRMLGLRTIDWSASGGD